MRLLAPITLLIAALGCGSYVPSSARPMSTRLTTTHSTGWPTAHQEDAARRAVDLARSFLATPYRYGGNSRKGLDCSGLTTLAFQHLGIQIPRTTAAQAEVGHWVAPDELRPGDLVFFGETRDTLFHVGLVVSGAGQPLRMIHSTTSRGVIETNVTDSAYWLRRFKFGRRVLP